jgi:hypothetical protein
MSPAHQLSTSLHSFSRHEFLTFRLRFPSIFNAMQGAKKKTMPGIAKLPFRNMTTQYMPIPQTRQKYNSQRLLGNGYSICLPHPRHVRRAKPKNVRPSGDSCANILWHSVQTYSFPRGPDGTRTEDEEVFAGFTVSCPISLLQIT